MREIIDCQVKETVGHDISFDFFQFLLQKNRISQEPITCSWKLKVYFYNFINFIKHTSCNFSETYYNNFIFLINNK